MQEPLGRSLQEDYKEEGSKERYKHNPTPFLEEPEEEQHFCGIIMVMHTCLEHELITDCVTLLSLGSK